VLVLYSDIADERYHLLRRYRSVVCLSVTFAYCAQTAEDIDTISYAYDSPMSLIDQIQLFHTSVDPSNFTPNCPTLVDLSVGDIRRQIAAE